MSNSRRRKIFPTVFHTKISSQKIPTTVSWTNFPSKKGVKTRVGPISRRRKTVQPSSRRKFCDGKILQPRKTCHFAPGKRVTGGICLVPATEKSSRRRLSSFPMTESYDRAEFPEFFAPGNCSHPRVTSFPITEKRSNRELSHFPATGNRSRTILPEFPTTEN